MLVMEDFRPADIDLDYGYYQLTDKAWGWVVLAVRPALEAAKTYSQISLIKVCKYVLEP